MKKFRDFIIEDHDGSGAAGLSSTPKPYDFIKLTNKLY